MRMGFARAALAAVALAIVHTWPLATAPHVLSRNDNGDALLNEWIMAWVQHQLPRNPSGLFQANIFYPARDTLAFSEPLIFPALLGAPVRLAGGSPVLVHNLVLLVGFTLSLLAMYALVVEWTGDRAAGLLAGSAFAFNTHTLMRLAHVQAAHTYGLPLALLATDRIVTRGGIRDAVWLALWMTVMAYTSGYLVVFAAIMIATAIAARIGDWWGRRYAVFASLALASMIAAVAILPVYLPYRRVADEQGLIRTIESVSEFSATLKGYLVSAGRLHMAAWSAAATHDPIDMFFPGFAVLGLAGAAVALAWRREQPMAGAPTRQRIVMLAAIAAVGVVLSLGTRTPIYGWVYQAFPPLHGIRAAARFGNLFLLAMAALAGIGLSLLRRGGSTRRASIALAVTFIALVNLEALRAPFEYRRFGGIPHLYTLLAQEPGRVVLVEQPFYPPQAVFENAEYVLNSTAHWRPLMNGYSGYTPASYRKYAETFWFFPEEHAIEAMRRAGVTHVMLHPHRFGRDAADVLRRAGASPYLERIAVGQHDQTLFRLR